MTNPLPPVGPADDDQDAMLDEPDRALDPDLDPDRIDSAEADERAAKEGVIDVDELP